VSPTFPKKLTQTGTQARINISAKISVRVCAWSKDKGILRHWGIRRWACAHSQAHAQTEVPTVPGRTCVWVCTTVKTE